MAPRRSVHMLRALNLLPVSGLVALGLLGAAHPCRADFAVDSAADAPVGAPDGTCGAGPGTCTLREAISEANNTPGNDVITFVAPFPDPAIISLTAGSLVVTEAIDIQGPGSGRLTIDAGGSGGIGDRVMLLDPGVGMRPTISLSGATIQGGFVNASPRNGGGILVGPDAGDLADVVMADVVLTLNEVVRSGGVQALGGGMFVTGGSLDATDCGFVSNVLTGNGNDFAGSGLYVHDATVSLTRCTVQGNRQPEGFGVGFRLRAGDATVVDSTFDDNRDTIDSGPQSWGGGIAIGTEFGSVGRLTARRCTLSRNFADQGAGLYLFTGRVDMTNCTVALNEVTCHAAGIKVSPAGILTMNNCTVAYNTVSNTRPGCFGNAGGLYTETGQVTVSNTIIAANLGFDGSPNFPNDIGTDTGTLAPAITSLGHNLFGVIDPAQGPFAPDATDIAGAPGSPIDPLLETPLALAGGPTEVLGPLAGSPALDAGSPNPVSGAPDCEVNDQRSLRRPIDSDGDGIRVCEIGSVEGCFGGPDPDADLISNICDNCGSVANPDQGDDDTDRVGNICDNCPRDANRNGVQTDCNADGDMTDPGEAIGQQCDRDMDAVGDVCDCFPDVNPDPPLNPVSQLDVRKSATPGAVTISWTAVPSVLGYNVYRGFAALGPAGFEATLPSVQCFGGGDFRITYVDDLLERPFGLFYYVASSFCTTSESILGTESDGTVRWPAPWVQPDCPSSGDVDADGIEDAEDNCPIANASQADSDGDFRGDACDACPLAFDPAVIDQDSDGTGDACDCDVDGDGVLNNGRDVADISCAPPMADNCPFTANGSQQDTDADGYGEACDNCPTDANPGQYNVDGDACGDACDAAVGDPTMGCP